MVRAAQLVPILAVQVCLMRGCYIETSVERRIDFGFPNAGVLNIVML